MFDFFFFLKSRKTKYSSHLTCIGLILYRFLVLKNLSLVNTSALETSILQRQAPYCTVFNFDMKIPMTFQAVKSEVTQWTWY